MFAARTGLISIGEALLPKVTLPSLTIPLPSFLLPRKNEARTDDIPFFHDNGILLAVPKKKVSHMKRRQKLYAPGSKQIKLKNNLNRCPACGHYKRSHFLCMNCVGQIQKFWKQRDAQKAPEPYKEEFANPLDEEVLYPGKTERQYERTLRKKEYLVRRPKTLPVEK